MLKGSVWEYCVMFCNVVRGCDRVFSHTSEGSRRTYGGYVVLANARIGESVRIALVREGRSARDTRKLGTDLRAYRDLLVTPVLPQRLINRIGIDGVGVVLLGRVLCGSEAGGGQEAEGEDGVHIDADGEGWVRDAWDGQPGRD
jgi:hypothetical protein